MLVMYNYSILCYTSASVAFQIIKPGQCYKCAMCTCVCLGGYTNHNFSTY